MDNSRKKRARQIREKNPISKVEQNSYDRQTFVIQPMTHKFPDSKYVSSTPAPVRPFRLRLNSARTLYPQ